MNAAWKLMVASLIATIACGPTSRPIPEPAQQSLAECGVRGSYAGTSVIAAVSGSGPRCPHQPVGHAVSVGVLFDDRGVYGGWTSGSFDGCETSYEACSVMITCPRFEFDYGTAEASWHLDFAQGGDSATGEYVFRGTGEFCQELRMDWRVSRN